VADCNILQHTPISVTPELLSDFTVASQEADTGVIRDNPTVLTSGFEPAISFLQPVVINNNTSAMINRRIQTIIFISARVRSGQ
jgi:hypothetical protein